MESQLVGDGNRLESGLSEKSDGDRDLDFPPENPVSSRRSAKQAAA
jgi:hypothetical protein